MESYLKLSIWICICQLILLTLFVAAASVMSCVTQQVQVRGHLQSTFYMFLLDRNCTAQNSNQYELNTLAFIFPIPSPLPFLCPFNEIYNSRLDMAWQCFNDKFQFVQN